MKKKRNLVLVFALLLVTALTGAIVAGTFAKYASTVDGGSGSATIAKWTFDTDNATASIDFSLEKTYDADTLVENRIAPGTQGSFSVEVSNANSEVGVEYSIAMEKENAPTNVKFYSDAALTNEITDDAPLTGTLAPKASAKTVAIYWKWAYETSTEGSTTAGDTADTSAGTAAKTMTVTAQITGRQVQPQ